MVESTPKGLHWFAVLLLCILTLTQPSRAFFPTTWRQKWFGNYGISHEQQTQTAFEKLAKRYFPKEKTLSRSMTIARDAMALANANVDQDYDHSAFHCDGENFDGAQQRLSDLKEKAVQALRKGNDDLARQELGSALHTLQDFYSHSNWVEMGNTKPHPDLGRGRPIVHAGFENATCSACGPTTEKDADGCPVCTNRRTLGVELNILTSGYAFAEDRPVKSTKIPETKCHHGGYIDNAQGAVLGFVEGMTLGTSMPGINKDSLNCGFSPHNYLHNEAVNLSIAATVQFIDDVKQELTEPQLKSLFGVGRTFSFFIDINAALKSSLGLIRAHSIRIVQDDFTQEASEYKIATFDGKKVKVTTQPAINEFKDSVSRLTSRDATSNRTTCLGLPLESILDHVRSLKAGSNLFLMAGSFVPENALAAEITRLAYAKDITIHSFHYPSGCPYNDNRIHKKVNGVFHTRSVYEDFASATGGATFSADDPLNIMSRLKGYRKREAQAPLISSLARHDSAQILAVEDKFPRFIPKSLPRRFTFPVDSSITQLKVSLKASTAGLFLIRPDGMELRPIIVNPKYTKVVMNGGEFFTVKSPAVGQWTAVVDGAGSFSLEAYGTTGILMSGFGMVRFTGRAGHQGFFPLKEHEQPKAKSNITAIGRLEGDFKEAVWDVRTPTGAIVRTNIMAPGNDQVGQAPRRSFLGTLQLNKGEYLVYAKGKNVRGEEFQRAWSERIKPK